jgi:predicted DNA binding protein
VNNLEYCVCRLCQYKTKTLYIKTKDNEEDSIGWKNCVNNILNKHDDKKKYIEDVKSAFRIATFDDYHKLFMKNNIHDDTSICEYCKDICYSKHLHKSPAIHIDHHLIPFHEILSKFVSDNSLTLSTVDIIYIGLQSHIQDERMKQEWIKYHNSVVTYRILCSSCNGRFGKHGEI